MPPVFIGSRCLCPAESIAFYSGEAREALVASGRLGRLVAVLRARLAWELGLGVWTNCYSYVTILVPALLTAPRYFAGEVEFGVITQVPLRMPVLVSHSDFPLMSVLPDQAHRVPA